MKGTGNMTVRSGALNLLHGDRLSLEHAQNHYWQLHLAVNSSDSCK